MAEIDRLRKARESMSKHFPLTPGEAMIFCIYLYNIIHGSCMNIINCNLPHVFVHKTIINL